MCKSCGEVFYGDHRSRAIYHDNCTSPHNARVYISRWRSGGYRSSLELARDILGFTSCLDANSKKYLPIMIEDMFSAYDCAVSQFGLDKKLQQLMTRDRDFVVVDIYNSVRVKRLSKIKEEVAKLESEISRAEKIKKNNK